jgi:hypothetical protein
MADEVMGKNTQIRLTDADGEKRWFNNTTHLETYLSDVASHEYAAEVLSRLASGEKRVVMTDGQFTDAYEFTVLPAIELDDLTPSDGAGDVGDNTVTTTIIIVQYVPPGQHDWRGMSAWDTPDEAEAAVTENISGWIHAETRPGSLKNARPERYRVIRRTITEAVLNEVDGDGKPV